MDITTAAGLYALLAGLQVGDAVPVAAYIADYSDGIRPGWTVAARQALDAGGVRLDLLDRANADMFDCAGIVVLAFPGRVLRTPVQPAGLAPLRVGGRLCDLAQQARYWSKRSKGATR